jgi:hypothetical protein
MIRLTQSLQNRFVTASEIPVEPLPQASDASPSSYCAGASLSSKARTVSSVLYAPWTPMASNPDSESALTTSGLCGGEEDWL